VAREEACYQPPSAAAVQTPEAYAIALDKYLSHANGYYPVRVAVGEMNVDDPEYRDYVYIREHRDWLVAQAMSYETRYRQAVSPNPPDLTMTANAGPVPGRQGGSTGGAIPLLRLCAWALGFGIASAGGFAALCLIAGMIWGICKVGGVVRRSRV
jgi:hypothetical protein